MYPASSINDLSAVDAALKAMELQIQAIKDRLREENEAIPKAKVLRSRTSLYCLQVGEFNPSLLGISKNLGI